MVWCLQLNPHLHKGISAASDLGLHCLPMSKKWDTRLILVNFGAPLTLPFVGATYTSVEFLYSNIVGIKHQTTLCPQITIQKDHKKKKKKKKERKNIEIFSYIPTLFFRHVSGNTHYFRPYVAGQGLERATPRCAVRRAANCAIGHGVNSAESLTYKTEWAECKVCE